MLIALSRAKAANNEYQKPPNVKPNYEFNKKFEPNSTQPLQNGGEHSWKREPALGAKPRYKSENFGMTTSTTHRRKGTFILLRLVKSHSHIEYPLSETQRMKDNHPSGSGINV